MRYLPDNNLSYPVLLEIGNGSGSGFFYRTDKKIFLVTASHVIYVKDNTGNDILSGNELILTSYDENLKLTAPISYSIDLSKVLIRKNKLKDIVLIELANISTGESTDNKISLIDGVKQLSVADSHVVVVPPQYLKKFKDVLISNEVFILGYPSSLGVPNNLQIEIKRPLLRKGIVAGLNISNETIILDCPVYFGNSGGIVLEVEEIDSIHKKIWIIGIVSQYVPFIESLKSLQFGYENHSFENSGYSIAVPIDTIEELTKEEPIKSK